MRVLCRHILPLLTLLLLNAVPAAFSQQYVNLGGTLSNDTIIRKLGADSAYLVTQSINVPAGVTLTINPGVVAYFTQTAALNVNGGSLLVNGKEADSVKLLCYELSRDWPGVQLKNISETNHVYICNAVFGGAVSAINLSKSVNVSIKHCSFYNYYGGNGVMLTDCSSCVIDSSYFFQCLSGIELFASESNSVCNYFRDNVFDKGQINLRVSNLKPGYYCYHNYIQRNCFQGASAAMYFEVAPLSFRNPKNYIQNNIITSHIPDENTGYLSFGLNTSMDSLIIQGNIFWNNDEAIHMSESCDVFIDKNTFYDNGKVVAGTKDQCTILMTHNVFSKTRGEVMEIPSDLVSFHRNNFLSYGNNAILLKNNSTAAVDARENYWQVISADSIEMLLIDDNDDPQLGPIVFDDFLSECDTVAPVSPPHDVRIQLVDETWRISWDENPEADIDHYALYYGDFKNYRFQSHIDSIPENSIDFEPVSALIAVAAFDGRHSPDAYALKGKSAYAFAEYYPYPGEDSSLCVGEGQLFLNKATIPYEHDSFYWSTNGTGTFSDSLDLHPTYFPSENDFESAGVELTLHVLSEETWKSASLRLDMKAVPEVFAGNDYYSSTDLPVTLDNATAAFYDSIWWQSLGDGYFSDPTEVYSVYYPGDQDIEKGSVTLVLSALSYCGRVADTVVFGLFETHSMEGRVWLNNAPRPGAAVVAVSLEESEFPFITGFYRSIADVNGYFFFDNLIAGDYVLYAFADTLDCRSGTSYYLNARQWQDAVRIRLDGNAYDIDISLPELVPDFPEGQGSIAGVFNLPDETFKALPFFCRSWFEEDSLNYCNGGLSNVCVSLMNIGKDQLLGFALTDAEGRFRFRNLPFGTYMLMVDMPRYGFDVSEAITLTPDLYRVEDVTLSLRENGRISVGGTSPSVTAKSDVTVYPNPVGDKLHLFGLSDSSSRVRVFDSNGLEVRLPCENDSFSSMVLHTERLPKGLYMIVVENQAGQEILKFVK